MLSERLKQSRLSAGLYQKELAKKLNLSASAYGYYEQGKCVPDAETLKRISEELKVSVDYLLGNTNDPKLKQGKESPLKVPVLGHVQAGVPLEAITDIIDWEEVSADMALAGELFALQIKGNSMEPKMSEGDVIIVRQQPMVENGEIAVVLINGDEATCKKVKRIDSGLVLSGLNPNFEPLFFSNSDIESLPVQIIGKVIELRAKF